ncbi:hypothetical protein PS732_02456 [Pseudomonas fluorescens]|uniref:Uncharacterized protein n=1 Tax=Pseudomonas fluorescens TaxID=294 RepID=A0ABD7VFC2_PSEFL|nr:hypothetical protein [Pseudomonas fluorescens]VVO92998.1 hypothetical protein PS732_02456 [Pseudomonas fluorescens]
MLADGSKVAHVQSSNFISEMVDSFNVSGIQTGAGAKISIIVGRDLISVRQETLISDGAGFRSEVLPEDMILSRHIVANLSIPLENAKSLIQALQTAVSQVEAAEAMHARGR